MITFTCDYCKKEYTVKIKGAGGLTWIYEAGSKIDWGLFRPSDPCNTCKKMVKEAEIAAGQAKLAEIKEQYETK